MIYYLQFNAANLPGVIQVTNQQQELCYYLIRTAPRWKINYELFTPLQTKLGNITQITTHPWANYQIKLANILITKLIHLTSNRRQLMIAPSLHWLVSGDLLANNYLVHDFHHHLVMSVDNIYLKNGHEGYLLQISPQVDEKIGLLLAAVLNQTSRLSKNQRSIKHWPLHRLRTNLSHAYDLERRD